LAGFTAIVLSHHSEFPNLAITVAAIIIFGGIIDFFDGFLARRLNVESDFGKQLDSFADLTTFGIAPVCFAHAIFGLPLPIILSTGIFVVAGIFRLARYNTGDFKKHFLGLPITVAGILLAVHCASFSFWANELNSDVSLAITTVFIVLLSVMMVSNVKVNRVWE